MLQLDCSWVKSTTVLVDYLEFVKINRCMLLIYLESVHKQSLFWAIKYANILHFMQALMHYARVPSFFYAITVLLQQNTTASVQ